MDHTRYVHNKERNFVCEVCTKIFSRRTESTYHVKSYHTSENPNVLIFWKIIDKKSSLKRHSQLHVENQDIKGMEKTESSYPEIERKKLNMEDNEKYILSGTGTSHCTICQKTFTRKKGLAKHIEFVHEKVMNFYCENCTKSFARKKHLTRHIENIHEKVEETHTNVRSVMPASKESTN